MTQEFDKALAEESLLDEFPNITVQEIEVVIDAIFGKHGANNPWDAVPLYKILRKKIND